MGTDTAGIHPMRFLECVGDTGMLGDVAIGEAHVWKSRFRSVKDEPSNDPHVCRISETLGFRGDLVLLVSLVVLPSILVGRSSILYRCSKSRSAG